ncbi:RNA polymerase sigma-70 factor [Sphingobacterium alkalisoli]|uniref:RNA polymerase sigma-70 factor n=2 Tax=Sphingobacterium TaxID=28453 RepID=A0A4U0PEB8_9SPHI|nr:MULTISPECIES: RNA polymerase sigma-70 factor [Sphingobacterium]TJY68441.1 RNA polymerase sigma-70 factor [Sphingobacterium alkalisoli]TJZ61064.1 RNA polymerase sigma-70 factor [Sphingobacterium olei]GGH06473.1 DNA-directed RNA polymerase sigma-70 factor [Sphingobacterium alkalisoli]
MEKSFQHTEDIYVTGLKAQDEVIFGKVYDLFWSRLYISAFNILRDREQAEDTVQEVFSYLWDNASTLEIKSLTSWLFTAVRYQVFNVVRSGKVRDRFERLHLIEETASNLAEIKLDNQDIQRRLMEGLEQLPPRCKEIFVMSRFEYLSYKEIAQKLQLSEKTVENQIAIALKKLRISLKDLAFILPFLLDR